MTEKETCFAAQSSSQLTSTELGDTTGTDTPKLQGNKLSQGC